VEVEVGKKKTLSRLSSLHFPPFSVFSLLASFRALRSHQHKATSELYPAIGSDCSAKSEKEQPPRKRERERKKTYIDGDVFAAPSSTRSSEPRDCPCDGLLAPPCCR